MRTFRWALAALAAASLALGSALSLSAQTLQSAVSPAPESMTVAAFMTRIAELRRTGPNWPLSPEAGELFSVISVVGTAYRQKLRDRSASGQPVEACLPAEAEIGSDTLLEYLTAYPEADAARTTIAEAFSQLVRAKFPCS